MDRKGALEKLEDPDIKWDMIVIGGGASGLGTALEASTRGYQTLLLEQHDFAKGTSSRSTKLVHGGVRYLAQGNLSLVLEALRERGRLKGNAPHLVRDQDFIIPCYRWFSVPFYTIGLTLYDLLSGRLSIGRSRPLSIQKTRQFLPEVKTKGLRGGVQYFDCQFDDARMAINLAQTIPEHGGTVLNYVRVNGLIIENGRITGVEAEEMENGAKFRIRSKVVINATGVFVDRILKMEDPEAPDVIRPSQGIHLVMGRNFLNGNHALMIPRTPDGRVLFAVPWHNRVVVGTTDVEKQQAELEPQADEAEVEYILDTASRYMKVPPGKEAVLSVFTGLRPLAAPSGRKKKTREISRGHKILISKGGLVTLTGGKWTTYRRMGEDVVDAAEKSLGMKKSRSVTREMKIHGFVTSVDVERTWCWYGSDLEHINHLVEKDPALGEVLSEKLHIRKVQVVWAVREEFARTLEDCLSRRIRALQLDAKESIRIAHRVAEIMASELGYNTNWIEKQVEAFTTLAGGHFISKNNRHE